MTPFKSNEQDISGNQRRNIHNQTIIIQQPSSNRTGTAGFVISLIALFLSWIPVFGWIIWFLGFILSFAGIFKRPRGLAIAGFILSIIDFIILIAIIGGIAALLSSF